MPERDAHFLENVLFLDAGTDQIGLYSFYELFEFITGYVVINQGRIAHFLDGAIIVVVMTEFITGADHFHAQIFISADHMTGTQAADI